MLFGSVKIAVFVQLVDIIAFGQQLEATRLHHRRIGLVEVLHHAIGESDRAVAFLCPGKTQLGLMCLQVDTDKTGFAFKSPFQNDIQLLAFVGDGHHMHFFHMA